jgi:hypothetical protein
MSSPSDVPDLLSVMFVRVCGVCCGAVAALLAHLAGGGSSIVLIVGVAAFVVGSLVIGRLFRVHRWWAWPLPASPSRDDNGESRDQTGDRQ